MPPPTKRVKAMTYRRDSSEVTQWLWLVFMQLTCDLFAIAKFLSVFMTYLESAKNLPNIRRIMSRRKSAGKKFDWPKLAENPQKNWTSRP